MEGHDDPALLQVAQAISDGTPVDWEKESAAREDLKGRLGRLRLLEAVASAHRSSPPPASTDSRRSGGRTTGSPAAAAMEVTSCGSGTAITHWGPLQVMEEIGHGGFGRVYRAFDPALQRDVALKLLNPSRSDTGCRTGRFLDEARRLARVRHPNVVVVHGADEHDGVAGLWTDLLEGKTLEQCLAAQGPFSAHEGAMIGIDLCRALAAVHGAGLIHRDVKTANVMREKGGRIVLLDFGSVCESVEDAHQTSGTPLTMAPELLLRREAPKIASDIYSLGVLLYRLTSGRYPVQAGSLPELLEMHRKGRSTPLRDARPDLPTAFVQAVERAIASEPERRFTSAGQMESAFAAFVGAHAPAERQPHAPAVRSAPRIAWVTAAAVLLALLVGLPAAVRRWTASDFSVEASLFRTGGGVEDRLLPGSRVEPGDQLFLEVRGSVPLHYYVLDEDDDGHTFALFPARLDLRNPLPPKVVQRLPGSLAGSPQYWQVTSAGGRERVVIIASLRPLLDLESEIEKLPRAAAGRPVTYPQLPSQTMNKLSRGIGGMVSSRSQAEGTPVSRISGLARLLSGHEESANDIWIRQIELENPAP